MKTLLTTLLTLCSIWLIGQTAIKPAELVQAAKAAGHEFPAYAALKASNEPVDLGKERPARYELFQLSAISYAALRAGQPEQFTLVLPSEQYEGLEIELVKVDPFAQGFQVIDSRTGQPADVDLGLHYRGIIKGDEQSIAALSLYENDLMGLFSSQATGNLVLG